MRLRGEGNSEMSLKGTLMTRRSVGKESQEREDVTSKEEEA